MTVTYADKPWLKHYDEGVPEKVEIPNHSLNHFLVEAARKFPEHPAIILKGHKISYRQ